MSGPANAGARSHVMQTMTNNKPVSYNAFVMPVAKALAVVALLATAAAAQTTTTPSADTTASVSVGRFTGQPLSFEERRERAGSPEFVSRGPRHTLTLTTRDAVLTLGAQVSAHQRALRMKLAGANESPRLAGTDLLPG